MSNFDKNGRFAEGNSASKGNSPYQKYAKRLTYLQETYTAEQVNAIASNPKRLNKLPVLDAIAFVHIAGAMTNIKPSSRSDVRAERETLIDRIEGKATQRIEQSTTITLEQLITEAYSKPVPMLDRIRANAPDALVIEDKQPLASQPDSLPAKLSLADIL